MSTSFSGSIHFLGINNKSVYFCSLTILLCQQATSLNVKLLLADLLFEPQLQVCPVTAQRDTTQETSVQDTPHCVFTTSFIS